MAAGIGQIVPPSVDRGFIVAQGDGTKVVAFDVIISEEHQSELVITDSPIETGVVVSDHAYMNPLRLDIEGAVTDTWVRVNDDRGVKATDPFEGASRSRIAFDILQQIQSAAEPFTVLTGLRSYSNMVIATLNVRQDKDTAYALFFRAGLREVIIASTLVITYPPRKEAKTQRQAAKTVDAGKQEPGVPDNGDVPKLRSILSDMTGLSSQQASAISFDQTSPELKKLLGPGSGL